MPKFAINSIVKLKEPRVLHPNIIIPQGALGEVKKVSQQWSGKYFYDVTFQIQGASISCERISESVLVEFSNDSSNETNDITSMEIYIIEEVNLKVYEVVRKCLDKEMLLEDISNITSLNLEIIKNIQNSYKIQNP